MLLDFDSLSWGNAEIDALGQVLPLCRNLEILYLGGNLFERLPESIGTLTALKKLWLTQCTSLYTLPDCLGDLPALKQIGLSGCYRLRSRPPKCIDVLKAAGCSCIGL